MVHPASVHGQAAVGTDALAGDVPARVGGKQEGAATACSTVAPAARAPRTSRPTAATRTCREPCSYEEYSSPLQGTCKGLLTRTVFSKRLRSLIRAGWTRDLPGTLPSGQRTGAADHGFS